MKRSKWPFVLILILASLTTVSCGLFEDPEEKALDERVTKLEQDKKDNDDKSDEVTVTQTQTITQTN